MTNLTTHRDVARLGHVLGLEKLHRIVQTVPPAHEHYAQGRKLFPAERRRRRTSPPPARPIVEETDLPSHWCPFPRGLLRELLDECIELCGAERSSKHLSLPFDFRVPRKLSSSRSPPAPHSVQCLHLSPAQHGRGDADHEAGERQSEARRTDGSPARGGTAYMPSHDSSPSPAPKAWDANGPCM
jgi:hypothetical protein